MKKLLYIIFTIAFASFYIPDVYNSAFIEKENAEFESKVENGYMQSKERFLDKCDKKEIKIANDFLSNQKESSIKMLKRGNLILSGPLNDFVQKVYNTIANYNHEIEDKKVVIIRNTTFNAFTMNQGIIYIHLGLLYHIQNEEQLAFIMCHELAHDYLYHVDRKILKKIKNDDGKIIEEKIKQTMAKKYGVVSELNQILLPYFIANSKESQNIEFEADSLGLVFYKKTNYDLIKGCLSFELMHEISKSKDTTKVDIKQLLKLNENIINEAKLNPKNTGSSLGEFKIDEDIQAKKDSISALLSSHPYEKERTKKLFEVLALTQPKMNLFETDPSYKGVKYWSNGELINTYLKYKNVGKTLFHALKMKEKYPNDTYAQNTILVSFYILEHYKSIFKEGEIVDMFSDYHDPNYNTFLHVIRKFSPNDCKNIIEHLEYNFTINYNSFEYKIIELLKLYKNKNWTEYKTKYEENKNEIEKSVYKSYIKDQLELIEIKTKKK